MVLELLNKVESKLSIKDLKLKFLVPIIAYLTEEYGSIDNSTYADDPAMSSNPELRKEVDEFISALQEDLHSEESYFRVTERVKGQRARTLIFGIEGDKLRVFDSNGIVARIV